MGIPDAGLHRCFSSWLLFPTILLLMVAGVAGACPSCKEALSGQDPASLQLDQGYARSIFLLMSAPYLLFAGLTFWIVRSARRWKSARRESPTAKR